MASRIGTFLIHAFVIVCGIAAALVVFSFFGGAELSLGNLVLRAQSGASFPLQRPAESALTAAPAEPPASEGIQALPKNVVVMMGDGMGIGVVSAASQLLTPPGEPLAMETAPVTGLMQTWAADILATDSAAAATAMATGHKTDKGVIGLLPDGRAIRTLFEAAREAGFATAVVTTSGLADATPGGFLAHVSSREEYDQVLSQVLDSKADILIGGDWLGKPKARRQAAYLEVIASAEERGAVRGATVLRGWEGIESAQPPLVVLLPPRPEMPMQHGPPLAEMAGRALDILEAGNRPFIILIETEVTDEAAHSNSMAQTVEAMRELDEAVAAVLDRVGGRNDTLVLVASDHETGGPHLLEGEYAGGEAIVRWAHEYHSSQLVPVFAFGPGAGEFSGVFDNTGFGVRIAALLGLEPFPSLADSQPN